MLSFILMILATGFFQAFPNSDDDDTRIGQLSRPFAEVTDPEMIRFFLDQFLIPESEVTKLEIIDVTANGFGPDDIVVTHPSMRAYIVEEPSEAALRVMRDWSLDDYRVDSDNIDPDLFDPEITGNVSDAAQNAIIADLLRTLNRNYAHLFIRLRLERDENGFTFEMWDFDEGSLQYTPSPPLLPDSVYIYLTEYDTIMVDRMRVGYQADPDYIVPDYRVVPDSIPFVFQTVPDITTPESPSEPDSIPSEILADAEDIEADPIEAEPGLPAIGDLAEEAAEPVEDNPQQEAEQQPVPDLTLPYFVPFITENDTIMIPGPNLYDVIYINKTVTDTVFLPVRE